MLDHLEARVGHSALILVISQHFLAIVAGSICPGEDGRDDNESLLLILMLVERLTQDLNDLFGLVRVSATHQIKYDTVSA